MRKISQDAHAFSFFWRWGSTLFPEKCVHTFLCKVMAILCLTKFRFLYLANNLEKPLFSAGQLHRFGKWCSRSYIYKHNFNKIIWWCTFNSTLSPGFKAGLIEGPANHLRNLELAWHARVRNQPARSSGRTASLLLACRNRIRKQMYSNQTSKHEFQTKLLLKLTQSIMFMLIHSLTLHIDTTKYSFPKNKQDKKVCSPIYSACPSSLTSEIFIRMAMQKGNKKWFPDQLSLYTPFGPAPPWFINY